MGTALLPEQSQLILQVRANPNDAGIFEMYYCIACRTIVAAGGLFPPLDQQTEHTGHPLAWVPAQDSLLPPHPAAGHILYWLTGFRGQLTPERFTELANYAPTTNSGNWVWLLRGPEQTDWLAYLDQYLERLSESWRLALNGQPSEFFLTPAQLWVDQHPAAGIQFIWPGSMTS